MGIRADLITFLHADSTIAGLVGTRIYGPRRPFSDTNADCIAFAITGSSDGHDLDGRGGWDNRELILNCRSKDYATAEQIADAVRKRMKGYFGAIGSTTGYSVIIQDEFDDYDDPQDGSPDGQYVIGQRYMLIRKESL